MASAFLRAGSGAMRRARSRACRASIPRGLATASLRDVAVLADTVVRSHVAGAEAAAWVHITTRALVLDSPPLYLNDYRAGALMDAVIHLSRANFDDFCRLADLAGLPK